MNPSLSTTGSKPSHQGPLLQPSLLWTLSRYDARDAVTPLCVAGTLFGVFYAAVNTYLYSAPSTMPTGATIERSLSYALILFGYLLLVPGVAGILVRRSKEVSSQRALLDVGHSNVHSGTSLSYFASLFPGGLEKDVDQAAPKCEWDDDDVQCAICLGELTRGDVGRILPCDHSFHAGCADLWLVTGRRNCCPMCMGKVVEDRDEEMVKGRR